MPLPRPVPRKLNHNRVIDCRGYERDDGLWDIEGHLTDTKACSMLNRPGSSDLPAGVPAHDMWIRLTVDLDMVVHDCVASTDSSPYALCGDIVSKFEKLKGHRIARGWTRGLNALIGGTHGCTHHWELLGRIAAVAHQATFNARLSLHKPGEIPWAFNTCHRYTPESEETLHIWPELYTGPKKSATSPLAKK